MTDNMISIEVAYALPDQQKIVTVDVPEGSMAYDAVVQSDIKKFFPEADIENAKMGLFGKSIKPKTQEVSAGDRIEIYRPLIADPKASRKARADKALADKDK